MANTIVPKTMYAELYDQNERINQLKRDAVITTKEDFMRKLTDDEIVEREHNLSDLVLEMQKADDKFKDINKAYREQKKSLEKRIKTIAITIAEKAIEDSGVVYYYRFDNLDMIGVYDGNGMLVRQRMMTPQERINTMFIEKDAPKNAENDSDVDSNYQDENE